MCWIDKETHDDILQTLRNPIESPPDELLRIYQTWLKDVVGAPDELMLVLHINPAKDQETPNIVFEPWKRTTEKFNSLFGPSWKMYVVKKGIFGQQDIETVVEPSIPCSRLQHLLVYDYHGEFKRRNRELADKLEITKFLELFRGTEPTHSVFYYPPVDEWTRLRSALGLIEAAAIKVMIVDERIQDRLKDSELRNRVERTNIEVPDINYATPAEEDAEYILKKLSEDQVHILVIHQGILDKIFAHERNIRGSIEDWIDEAKKRTKFVVVISDRGKPENVPNNARFADYAVVDKFVSMADYSKFLLTQALLASTTAG